GRRDVEDLGRLVQALRLRTLADLDGESAGSRGILHPRMRVCVVLRAHASGAASGSSATHSSSSARSACQAAYSTPIAAAAPSTRATAEPRPGPFFSGTARPRGAVSP